MASNETGPVGDWNRAWPRLSLLAALCTPGPTLPTDRIYLESAERENDAIDYRLASFGIALSGRCVQVLAHRFPCQSLFCSETAVCRPRGVPMKCLYYVAPTLDSTRTISDDLHQIGIKDWYMHVISKDKAGLRRAKIHSSNEIETLDILRTSLLGASAGFLIGLVGAAALLTFDVFGESASIWAYSAVVVVATMFGAWFGGLLGFGTENHKLREFHDDIESGKYLFLIYARSNKLDAIREMMRLRHPESMHVATDAHYLNPLGNVHRHAN